MPAEERLFEDSPPKVILLDTSFVVAHLVAGEKQHEECLSFSEKLQAAGTVVVYSAILRPEYLNAWRTLIQKGYLPSEPAPQMRMELGALQGERLHWLRIADRLLRQFLSDFYQKEVRLNRRVLNRMVDIMGRHNLKSYDAIHIASASDVGCRDIASFDSDFRRIDGIRLWNNGRG
jgi:predicted nucleic acid-binding protein